MNPVTVSTSVARPIDEVYAYLEDIANHAEFSDHFAVEWHLTREDSIGPGAGARFKLKRRLGRFPWMDVTIAEAERPRRIVEVGRAGKFNRNRVVIIYTLEAASANSTRVTMVTETEPKLLSDRMIEATGLKRWTKRKTGRALRRLRTILEEDHDRGTRVTVAGGARKPASNFRL